MDPDEKKLRYKSRECHTQGQMRRVLIAQIKYVGAIIRGADMRLRKFALLYLNPEWCSGRLGQWLTFFITDGEQSDVINTPLQYLRCKRDLLSQETENGTFPVLFNRQHAHRTPTIIEITTAILSLNLILSHSHSLGTMDVDVDVGCGCWMWMR